MDPRGARLFVKLRGHSRYGGETLEAVDLGAGLFQVRTIPLAVRELHLEDVVRATESEPNLIPQVREIVRRSGHRTVHLRFTDADVTTQEECLGALRQLGAGLRREDPTRVAIDVPPEADPAEVDALLSRLERAGGIETGGSAPLDPD